ncbi:hypothetical protein ACFQZ4_00800 [Catellatospora coxensis]
MVTFTAWHLAAKPRRRDPDMIGYGRAVLRRRRCPVGGRSYMLATRMPMSRDGFDTWLSTPLPDLGVLANPDQMWRGWAADDVTPDWELTAIADSPAAVATYRANRTRTPLELLTARAAAGFTLARHHRDALEIYLYDYHADHYGAQTDLLMLAGAGRFADGGAEVPVLYWGGDVYPACRRRIGAVGAAGRSHVHRRIAALVVLLGGRDGAVGRVRSVDGGAVHRSVPVRGAGRGAAPGGGGIPRGGRRPGRRRSRLGRH